MAEILGAKAQPIHIFTIKRDNQRCSPLACQISLSFRQADADEIWGTHIHERNT